MSMSTTSSSTRQISRPRAVPACAPTVLATLAPWLRVARFLVVLLCLAHPRRRASRRVCHAMVQAAVRGRQRCREPRREKSWMNASSVHERAWRGGGGERPAANGFGEHRGRDATEHGKAREADEA